MPNTFHPDGDSNFPMLDGVGITPEPERDPLPPAPIVEAFVPEPAIRTEIPYLPTIDDRDVQLLFVRSYALVAAALLISAIVASLVSIPSGENGFELPLGFQLLILLEVGFVAVLVRYVTTFPRALAAFLLFFWAGVNGVSFSFFFHWISPVAIAYGFLMSSAAFAITAGVAYKRVIDLGSNKGIYLLFGVGFALIASLTLSLRLSFEYWQTAVTGFGIFACLAWFFMADIRDLDLEFEDDLSGWKSAVCGALLLYLNFVNLYLLATRLGAILLSSSGDDRSRKIRF